MALGLGETIAYAVIGTVIFVAGSLAADVVSPYAAAVWAVVSAGLLAYFDDGVCDFLDPFIQVYHNNCGAPARAMARLGLPVRVFVKCLFAPIVLGHVFAAVACSTAAEIPSRTARQKDLAVRYACASFVAVCLAYYRQTIWSAPRDLDQKPVTLALLLVPLIVGWDVLASATVIMTSSYNPYYQRDLIVGVAGVLYNVYLFTRRGGTPPQGILTAGSLESGYGAAKILFLVHASHYVCSAYAFLESKFPADKFGGL